MKLYDFSIFAERRKERDAAKAVSEVFADLNNPASVLELKARVNIWIELHHDVLKRAGNCS
jgi:hypothetical protein